MALNNPEAYLEENIPFAHCVAQTLNGLIDAHVLTSVEVSGVSNEAVFRFMMEFYDNVIKFARTKKVEESFEGLEQEKLKKIFSQMDPEEKERIKQETLVLTRELFDKLKQENQDLKGILVFGSRMKEHVRVNSNSDTDIVLVYQGNWNNLPKSRNRRFEYKEMQYDAHAMTEHDFIATCGTGIGAQHDILNTWEYQPSALYYIGTLENFTESEVNANIQFLLTSPQVEDIKKRELESVKHHVFKNIEE